MITVTDILSQKKPQPLGLIAPEQSVFEAIELMATRNLGALVVVDEGKLIGIITERDYSRNVVLKGRSSKDTLVKDIMTRRVIYVTQDTKLEHCMALILNKFIRHLPVLDGDRVIDIISTGDVMKAGLGEKEFIIEELVRYITDSPMIMQEQRREALEQNHLAARNQTDNVFIAKNLAPAG